MVGGRAVGVVGGCKMVTRWDPTLRAGAVGIRSTGLVERAAATAQTVADWADYQKLGGDIENVETSPITGQYDWRAYIQEETELARRRDDKPRPRKADVAPAPSVYYV